MAELLSMAGRGPLLIEVATMQMNPYESSSAERAMRSDPDLIARVQAIETVLPTLATRVQLEQLRGEMKEGFGAVRTEMQAMRADLQASMGEMRVDMHRTVNNTMKWSIGVAISCVGLAATFVTTVMPLIVNHAR
ncbi:hypothetical protein [Mitsuaria sp. 7]|uniref:hypothetical protein n=1 Tax=Mitsuaria sp. 7 TaxID=1658665 RepID=UPI0007DE249E|nr:hypothetical protein [Mitsuaria sp. 7]ANH67366.1 hypothetical protein ABE85_06890 [Mitsuaria sp. 7]